MSENEVPTLKRILAAPTTKVPFTEYELVVPVFTPLNEDNSVNYGVIPAYAQYLAAAGVESVLVGSTTSGEHKTLSVSDRNQVIEAWVAVSETSRLHIQVLIELTSSEDMAEQARHCKEIGVHSLLIHPKDPFNPATDTVEDLVDCISQVAMAAPKVWVLYYHMPGRSNVEGYMSEFEKAATSSIANFKGLKFTSNDWSEKFLGTDTLLDPEIRSSIDTTFNVFPNLALEIQTAVKNDEIQSASQLQQKLSLAIEAHTCEGPLVSVMKAGMEIVSGIIVDSSFLLQESITTEVKQRIESKLRGLGLVN